MTQKINNTFIASQSVSSSDIVIGNKVLHLLDCTTTQDALNFLSSRRFSEKFNGDALCFVVAIELIEKPSEKIDLEVLENIFQDDKALIISFESKSFCSDNFIVFKEAGSRNFKKIGQKSIFNLHDNILQNNFDLETLLHILSYDGSFSGKFLEMTVDFDQRFNDMRLMELAVSHNNVLCIKFLRLFNYDLSSSNLENKKLLEMAAKSCDFQGFLALLDLPADSDFATFVQALESLEIFHQQNAKHFNLLMIATESGNADAVNFLLKCSFDVNQQRDVHETAADLAWQRQNFDIFLKLLLENSLFPEDFQANMKQLKERGKVKNVLTFVNDLNNLHQYIKRGRIDGVKDFLAKYPSTRHAYNVRNESAAATALRSEQFGIYEFLISQGICLGPQENISDILTQKESTGCHDPRRTMMKKICLHEIHKKHFKSPFEKHLMTLLTNSSVGFDSLQAEHREYFKFIKEAYEFLNEIPEIAEILKIVAKSPVFKVIFDFKRDSVSYVDPLTCQRTKGTSYFKSGHMFVTAKGLLSESTRFEVLGTLAHELTHFAMQLVYENFCKPYRDDDSKTKAQFETIACLCEFNKDKEEKIFFVFNYPVGHRDAELIVRVPHLLALYKNDEKKLGKCRKDFEELFEFFSCKVLPDVRNEESLMVAKRETSEINEWLGVCQSLLDFVVVLKSEKLNMDLNAEKRNLLVITNCIKLTSKAIYQQIQRQIKGKVENFVIFARPSDIDNPKTKIPLEKALKLPTRPMIVFRCDDDVTLFELENVIKALNANERVIFVVKDEGDGRFHVDTNFQHVIIRHSWDDFPPSSQNELWKFEANFQGKEMTLRDVMSAPSKATENIPFCDLLRHKLKISEPIQFNDIDFFVERKLFSESHSVLSFKALTEHLKANHVLLLSDDPGAGKTTTFKTFAAKLKDEFPLCWVAYLDLKQFIDNFEQNEFNEWTNEMKVARFFGEKLFLLECFDLEIFCQLFVDNRVILLMDGIDEICPNLKSFIVKLLKAVSRFSKNQLLVSTRPHVAKDLSVELDQELFHLMPFSVSEQKSFYFKFFAKQNVPPPDLHRYVKGIEKLMNYLSENRLFWSTITTEISTNPLFMRIVSEIYDDVVMNQPKNGKCLSLCNLFLMYEKCIDKKLHVWMRKGKLSITDQLDIHRSSKSLFRAHTRLALEQIFKDTKIKFLVEDQELTEEQILRVGLVTTRGVDLHFLHRTYAEFFVADFLFKNIFASEPQNPRRSKEKLTIMRLFVRVLTSENFQMIRAFLGNALELVKHEKEGKRWNRMGRLFKTVSKPCERDQMLDVAVGDGCVNLTTLILQFSASFQCILMQLTQNTQRNLENVLTSAIKLHSTNIETVRTLWESAKSVYSSKDVKQVLLKVNPAGNTLLHSLAANGEPAILDFLLKEIQKVANETEFRQHLMLVDKSDRNALETAIKINEDQRSVAVLWSFYENFLTEETLKLSLIFKTFN